MLDYALTRSGGVASAVLEGELGEELGLVLHEAGGGDGVLVWVLLHVLRV